ncbi:methyltransferase-like protein 27 [Cherax quadricarinatus]|uniref:methyltransferase-like protein 27 n=1 Tax=Cherax quadricarinatus TaxID=27406 RepID=UPI00387EA16F
MDKRNEKDEVSASWILDRINPGISPTKLIGVYDEICSNYDKNVVILDYGGPSTAAEEIANMVPEKKRQQVRVLDVAAGTGLVGCHLHKKGFTNIDALEPSEGMMNILKKTGVYTLKYQEFIGTGHSTVPKGGLVVILMRLEFFLTLDEYKDKMENFMDRLEKTNVWRKEVKKTVPNFYSGKEGILFIYRVL